MEYFIIETDEGNRIPYHINKNRAVDIRILTKDKINALPMWNVVEMDFPKEGFFPDLLCSPCIMVSRCFMETVMMYQSGILHKGVKLWNRESGINATYFLPIFEDADCISEKTQYNNVGNRIVKLVIQKSKIRHLPVFKIKGYDRNCIIGRLDLVESLLRRGICGIKLEKVLMDDEV